MARWRNLEWFLAEWVGTWLWGLICRSLRLEVHGDEQLEAIEKQFGAIVFVSWHFELLATLYHHRHVGGYAFVSEHADGELIARALRRIGYTSIRGSTTHGGARGLIQLVRKMREGGSLGFVPDGPRGPRCVAQPGVVVLSQKSGCPIVPMGFASRRFWQLRSWDRFRVPKPWSRAVLCYGEPILVPPKLTEADLEVWRKRVEDAITEATRRAEALVGIRPEQSAFAEP